MQIRIGLDALWFFKDDIVLLWIQRSLATHAPRFFQNIPLDIDRHASLDSIIVGTPVGGKSHLCLVGIKFEFRRRDPSLAGFEIKAVGAV